MEKGIVIKKVSQTNSDRPVTRSKAILNADRIDKGKKKVEDSTSKSIITCPDPLFKSKIDFYHLEEVIEKEVDYSYMNKKRKIFLGFDWDKKLKEKKGDT